MMKVKSFAISDDVGINALLETNRLATGAHILVSEGQVCIPYEDGKPEPLAHRIIAIGEQKAIIQKQLDILVHSQKVVVALIADAADRFKVAHAQWDTNRSNKQLEAAKNDAERKLAEVENQKLMNKEEIVRLTLNLNKFDEQLAELN